MRWSKIQLWPFRLMGNICLVCLLFPLCTPLQWQVFIRTRWASTLYKCYNQPDPTDVDCQRLAHLLIFIRCRVLLWKTADIWDSVECFQTVTHRHLKTWNMVSCWSNDTPVQVCFGRLLRVLWLLIIFHYHFIFRKYILDRNAYFKMTKQNKLYNTRKMLNQTLLHGDSAVKSWNENNSTEFFW